MKLSRIVCMGTCTDTGQPALLRAQSIPECYGCTALAAAEPVLQPLLSVQNTPTASCTCRWHGAHDGRLELNESLNTAIITHQQTLPSSRRQLWACGPLKHGMKKGRRDSSGPRCKSTEVELLRAPHTVQFSVCVPSVLITKLLVLKDNIPHICQPRTAWSSIFIRIKK